MKALEAYVAWSNAGSVLVPGKHQLFSAWRGLRSGAGRYLNPGKPAPVIFDAGSVCRLVLKGRAAQTHVIVRARRGRNIAWQILTATSDLDELVDWPVVRGPGSIGAVLAPGRTFGCGVVLSGLFNYPDYLGTTLGLTFGGCVRSTSTASSLGVFFLLFIGEC